MKRMNYLVIVAVACVVWLFSQIGGCQERKNSEAATNPEKEHVRPHINPNNTKVVVGYHKDKEGGEVKNTTPEPTIVTTPTCPYDGWKFCYNEGGLALFGPLSNTLVSEDHAWKKAKREQNLMRQWFKPSATTVNKQGLQQTEILPIAKSSKFTSYTTYPIIWEVNLNNPSFKKRQKVQMLMEQDHGPCKMAEVQPNGDLYEWKEGTEQAKLAMLSFTESVRFVYLQGYEDTTRVEVGYAPVAQEIYVSTQPPPAVTLPTVVAPPTTTPPAADTKPIVATTPVKTAPQPASSVDTQKQVTRPQSKTPIEPPAKKDLTTILSKKNEKVMDEKPKTSPTPPSTNNEKGEGEQRSIPPLRFTIPEIPAPPQMKIN